MRNLGIEELKNSGIEEFTFTLEDDRFDYGEERFITLGLSRVRLL